MDLRLLLLVVVGALSQPQPHVDPIVVIGGVSASSASGGIVSSVDGVTWSSVPVPFMSAVSDVTYCERYRRWLAVGSGASTTPNRVASFSWDGVNWRAAATPDGLRDCTSVAYNELLDVAIIGCSPVTATGSTLAISTDGGFTYRLLPNNFFTGDTRVIDMATDGQARWVAVSLFDGVPVIMRSDDKGTTWTSANFNTDLAEATPPFSVTYSRKPGYHRVVLFCVLFVRLFFAPCRLTAVRALSLQLVGCCGHEHRAGRVSRWRGDVYDLRRRG